MGPLARSVNDWRAFLAQPPSSEVLSRLQCREWTERLMRSERFVANLKRQLGHLVQPQTPDRKHHAECAWCP